VGADVANYVLGNAVAVPEPASLSLLASTAPALLLRRRRIKGR
jgi:hypothetical protein